MFSLSTKLLKGTVSEVIQNGSLKKYYPHGTGHYLGMDVHDVGKYKQPLEKGMVFTVEPGLYFQTYHTEVPERFRGIGVRIEDNILVTDSGYENLTQSVPKAVAEIEALK